MSAKCADVLGKSTQKTADLWQSAQHQARCAWLLNSAKGADVLRKSTQKTADLWQSAQHQARFARLLNSATGADVLRKSTQKTADLWRSALHQARFGHLLNTLALSVSALPTLVFGFLSAIAPSFAGTAGQFTIEQVMSAPFASEPLAAPKGATVAWLLNEQGKRNIWVASGPDWKGRKVTNFDKDDGQEIAELAWTPDGSYLLFARGGDFENNGDAPNPDASALEPTQDIWSVPVDGSAPPKKLTAGRAPAISSYGNIVAFVRNNQIFTMTLTGVDAKAAVVTKGKVESLTWSPDGTTLAFVSSRRDHSFIGVYFPAEKTLHYLDPSVDMDGAPAWSPDSTKIAFLRVPVSSHSIAFGPRREAEPWSIRETNVRTGESREVFHADKGPGSVFHSIVAERQIFWSAGNRLIFPWEKTGWCHLYDVSADGVGNAVELTPGEGEVEHVVFSEDRKTLYYSSNIGEIDNRHLWRLDATGKKSPQQITKGEDIQWSPAPTGDDSALIFLTSSYNQKSHAAVRTADGKMKPLAPETIPTQFPAAALVKPELVKITASDGMQIHGQLFLPPPAKRTNKMPALIFFHGGSRRQMLLGFHYMYYYSNAYAMNQYLASQGYVVLSVNYRSGIGYGLNFREALNYGATGASEYNDVSGAGIWLKSRPDVDSKRVGLWGGSYGGYLTALGLARASDMFAAGVDFHGVHDWNLESPTVTLPYNPNTDVNAARVAWESSPMSSVSSWRSPVLLIQGDDDRNVPFAETLQLAEALRKQHVYFEQLIIPNEIHDFLEHRHWIAAYRASADFFSRKLLPIGKGDQ